MGRIFYEKECMDELREECGVFGIINESPMDAVGITASALMSLQHRGQEGAGISYFRGDRLMCKKDLGLVADVFDPGFLASNRDSSLAVGHVRYSTTGRNSVENTQPISTIHSKLSFALCHNGNIANAAQLREQIVAGGGVLHTTNDSEIISILIVYELLKGATIEKAIFNVMDVLKGAFSLIIGTKDKLLAARDMNGFRPLCLGTLKGAVVLSSESCALDNIGAEFIRDILPGEIVSIDRSGKISTMQKDLTGHKRGLCVFEFIYFARPDSVIDGMSVYNARLEMGRELYRQLPTEADLVCGTPDSGLDAAYGYFLESGIPIGTAFIKNRYVGRSFIVPSQAKREEIVRYKLNPLKASIKGKRIILVDDSIVRGTTSTIIIKILREAGAREVHMRVSSPPFRHPCYFGTDIDSRENLIANHLSVDEICRKIGADSLAFLEGSALLSIKQGMDVDFCSGCFSGRYPIDVEETGKEKFEK